MTNPLIMMNKQTAVPGDINSAKKRFSISLKYPDKCIACPKTTHHASTALKHSMEKNLFIDYSSIPRVL
jgi:hypothetical protein